MELVFRTVAVKLDDENSQLFTMSWENYEHWYNMYEFYYSARLSVLNKKNVVAQRHLTLRHVYSDLKCLLCIVTLIYSYEDMTLTSFL